jgi:hypothetical protein
MLLVVKSQSGGWKKFSQCFAETLHSNEDGKVYEVNGVRKQTNSVLVTKFLFSLQCCKMK